MMKYPLSTVMLSLAVYSCSYEPEQDGQHLNNQSFSEAEKQAAALLAVGEGWQPTVEDTPEGAFERAVSCRTAFEMLREQLGEKDSFNRSQSAALAQAAQTFENRARRLGEEAGKTSTKIDALISKALANANDTGEQARLALSCARQLQRGD